MTSTLRISGSHKHYLELGCQVARTERGRLNGGRATEIHYYGPCGLCGEEMRDVDENGYEDVSRSPYSGEYYGPPAVSICTSCAGRRHRESIDLTGRMARCSYSHKRDGSVHEERYTRPSEWSLPFFEFRGEGSKQATQSCKHCGYYEVAHRPVNPLSGRPGIQDHVFEPAGPAEFDLYYCGCFGWD